MSMGRTRKSQKGLPERIYKKCGTYYFVDKQNKWHNLGRNYHDALIRYAELNTDRTSLTNLNQVMDRYLRDIMPTKAQSTQKGQIRELQLLRSVFGRMHPNRVTPPDIYAYMDRRPPVKANREKALLSHVFTYAIRWGAATDNPCKKVVRNTETPAGAYVEKEQYQAVYDLMPAPLRVAMDIALITGLRQGDVLKLTRACIQEEGLLVQTSKTGRKILFSWTPDLLAAIEAGKALKSKIATLYLVCNKDGQPYASSGFQTIWGRTMRNAIKDGELPAEWRFKFKDLRTTAGSDTTDDNLLGHTNRTTLYRHYKVKPIKVTPIR